TGPAPRSLNSGNSTAVTTIIPATRQAARKPKKMTKRRPISAIQSSRPQSTSTTKNPHPEERRLRRVSKDEAPSRASWFETPIRGPSQGGKTSSRHRHRAQRLPLPHRQFFGLGFQLPAGGKDIAAARRAHRRGIAGVENILGEFLDLI